MKCPRWGCGSKLSYKCYLLGNLWFSRFPCFFLPRLPCFLQASQIQPAQLKKEANKEFVKDVSKKIKGNTPALGLAKNNELNKER